MTPEILAEHDEDCYLSVSRPRRGTGYQLVFDGPGRVETVIRFDELDVGRSSIRFYRRRQMGARVETGSIEHDLTAWGDVGEWLQGHATSPTTPS